MASPAREELGIFDTDGGRTAEAGTFHFWFASRNRMNLYLGAMHESPENYDRVPGYNHRGL